MRPFTLRREAELLKNTRRERALRNRAMPGPSRDQLAHPSVVGLVIGSLLAMGAVACSSGGEAPPIPAENAAPAPSTTTGPSGSATTEPPPPLVPDGGRGVETGVDAATPDATETPDASSDAAIDAQADAQTDGSSDAGMDAAVDAPVDSGPTNQAPTISITSPTAASSYGMPVTVGVSVAAADADGSVEHVEFYADGVLLGSLTAPPYHVSFEPSATGAVSLKAKAFDNLGAVTTSAAVSITIGARSPKIYFVHNDALGTPRLMADAAKKTVWRWDQDEPFGDSRPNEDPDADGAEVVMNVRLPGQYYDVETGLSANGFRDYDGRLGRYIESDPIGLRGGMNPFGYVGAQPLTLADPLGLQAIPIGPAAGGLGLGGAFGGVGGGASPRGLDPKTDMPGDRTPSIAQRIWDAFGRSFTPGWLSRPSDDSDPCQCKRARDERESFCIHESERNAQRDPRGPAREELGACLETSRILYEQCVKSCACK